MAKVPGTFKQALSDPIRAADHPSPEVRRWGADTEANLLEEGALVAFAYVIYPVSIIVAREPVGKEGEYRWHLSIAHPTRYPTWDEIKFARYTIPVLKDVRLMVQLLPKIESDSDWTNKHENCFHLYECHDDLDLQKT